MEVVGEVSRQFCILCHGPMPNIIQHIIYFIIAHKISIFSQGLDNDGVCVPVTMCFTDII